MGAIEILGEYIIDITQCANTPTNGAIFNGAIVIERPVRHKDNYQLCALKTVVN